MSAEGTKNEASRVAGSFGGVTYLSSDSFVLPCMASN